MLEWIEEGREPNTQYVLSLSYGKDSMATIEACRLLHYPLDRIVTCEVWATDTISADLPPMVEFKDYADRMILERYGIEVEHVCAMNKDGTKKTYEQLFYHIPKRRTKKTVQDTALCGGGRPTTARAWDSRRRSGAGARSSKWRILRSYSATLSCRCLTSRRKQEEIKDFRDGRSLGAEISRDGTSTVIYGFSMGGGYSRGNACTALKTQPANRLERNQWIQLHRQTEMSEPQSSSVPGGRESGGVERRQLSNGIPSRLPDRQGDMVQQRTQAEIPFRGPPHRAGK